jgi:two-component system sensor histidine kinase TctE
MPRKQPLLRTQLLVWLLVPLFVLLCADTFISYWIALSFSRGTHDRTLVEVARETSLYLRGTPNGLALDIPDDAKRLLLTDPVDHIFVALGGTDGRRISGSDITPARHDSGAKHESEILYDGLADGEPVRIVEHRIEPDKATGRPGAILRVAETRGKRDTLARDILLSVIVPQIFLILIAGVVVWVGVVLGLAPLDRLQRAIASRSHRDCTPLVVDRVPGELNPLLGSINELLARLDRVLILQNRFISDAAHQLKTPVAVLMTQVEVAAREEDQDRMRQAVMNLYPGLERVSRVLSQLLSLARNEPEAQRTVALAPLDLNAVTLEAASDWVPRALAEKIDLGFEGAETPVMIRGEAMRLREMLDNLIDNAVRYSRVDGRVTVRVSASPVPTIEVNDDGPSIPPEERSRVFERFHRLLGTAHEGSGLGLAIAQEIATIHGAEISLRDDSDGIGNTFSISFPPFDQRISG